MTDSVLLCATGHECDGTEPCRDLCHDPHLTPEDPCPACGSVWSPHRCSMATAVAHHRREPS